MSWSDVSPLDSEPAILEMAIGVVVENTLGDGPNVRQAYDAAWFDWEKDPWRVISFWSEPVIYVPDGDKTLQVEGAEGAQLFDGMGDFHRAISTKSSQAQAYFDQGMRYLWAFNHDEATRSFAKAAQDDPQCAMCYWGVALTVGPNYNLPMMVETRAKVAWEALQLAERYAGSAAPVEQGLIRALGSRYQGPQPLDTSNEGPVLAAYAQAMQEVASKFPRDADVQTLTAEAMMNVNAWKLWTLDGAPAPGTEAILTRLEAVLAKSPYHPGANHYYIHAVEASPHPEKGLAAAMQLIIMGSIHCRVVIQRLGLS